MLAAEFSNGLQKCQGRVKFRKSLQMQKADIGPRWVGTPAACVYVAQVAHHGLWFSLPQ